MRTPLLVCLASILLNLAACAVNPVTGKKELSIIPASQEVAIGRQNFLPYQQVQGGSYVVDPNLTQYVSRVGKKIAAVSDRSKLPYEFVVLNNSVPNAWALPGGKIAINRGLLTELDDEAQLAAVLAHEIVHAAAKHSVQRMQQGQLISLGVMAAGVAAKDTDYGDALAMGAGLGGQLLLSRYGREQELESDQYGIEYMVKAGYDPYAAVELQETFVRLSKSSGNSNWIQGLFASHPPSQERVNKNRAKADAIGKVGVRNQKQFQQAIRQIVKDQPAYAAHEKAIKAAQANKPSEALGILDTAIKLQPEEHLFYTTQGQIFLAQKNETRATQSFSKALSLNPDYYVGHLGLGLVQKKQKKLDQAKQHLLKSQTLVPTPTAAYHLGEIELAQGNRAKAIEYFNVVAQQEGELGEQARAHLKVLQPTAQ